MNVRYDNPAQAGPVFNGAVVQEHTRDSRV
jgi:hypothetical protein